MVSRKSGFTPLPISQLERLSIKLRRKVITSLYQAGSGHPAGSLSSIDILIALYFGGILKYQAQDPGWLERDRFLLSAGHYCPALYTVLAEAGFFPEQELSALRSFGSGLQGHPEKGKLAGVETSSGSLGQGLSLGVGLALAAKKERRFDYNVFILLSDAEHQEGQIWEAVMSAYKFKLNNLVAIVDRNQIQIGGLTSRIMPLDSLTNKYRSFGWQVIETNGHEFRRLLTALHQARTERQKPSVVVADTIAGKGVSFMEGKACWHDKALTEQDWQRALGSLKGK
ncbi:MAG: transketolase [Candidatus Shapirobacteria bacterium]